MFLRCSKRRKDGKEHLYWSVVENRRLNDQRVVQRHVLYLGELGRRAGILLAQDRRTLWPRRGRAAPSRPVSRGARQGRRVSRRARATFANGPAPPAPMRRLLAGLPVTNCGTIGGSTNHRPATRAMCSPRRTRTAARPATILTIAVTMSHARGPQTPAIGSPMSINSRANLTRPVSNGWISCRPLRFLAPVATRLKPGIVGQQSEPAPLVAHGDSRTDPLRFNKYTARLHLASRDVRAGSKRQRIHLVCSALAPQSILQAPVNRRKRSACSC